MDTLSPQNSSIVVVRTLDRAWLSTFRQIPISSLQREREEGILADMRFVRRRVEAMRPTLARTQIKTFIEVTPIQASICPCVSNGRLPDGSRSSVARRIWKT